MARPFHHIVLFRIHPGTFEEEVEEAIEGLRSLGAFPGITSWRVERSLDERKGTVLVQVGTFEDEAAFARYRASPGHRVAGEAMAAISDWLVGDFVGS